MAIQRSDQPRGHKKSKINLPATCQVNTSSTFKGVPVRTASISCEAVTRMQGYSLRSFPSLHLLNSRWTPEWRPENSLRDEAI